jgi:hypothetical protein
MTPGPRIIRVCTACAKYIKQFTWASGNTFGARFWTDGKVKGHMFPASQQFVKCPHCSALVWIYELKEVDRIAPREHINSADYMFKDACPPIMPTMKDTVDFLARAPMDKEKELYLRVQIWWAGNDPRRESDTPPPLEPLEKENLRILAPLLREGGDREWIMGAETFRERGMFKKAEEWLDEKAFDGFPDRMAGAIRELSRKRIATVQELKIR